MIFDCFLQHTSTNTSCLSRLVKLDNGPTKVSKPKDSLRKPNAALPRHFVKRSLGFSTPFRKAKINLPQATRSFNHSMRVSKCLLLFSECPCSSATSETIQSPRTKLPESRQSFLHRTFQTHAQEFSQARHLLCNRLESKQLTFHA